MIVFIYLGLYGGHRRALEHLYAAEASLVNHEMRSIAAVCSLFIRALEYLNMKDHFFTKDRSGCGVKR